MLDGKTLFTEHFCNDKDDEGSEKAAASKEINQGIANGGKNGMDYYRDHKLIKNLKLCRGAGNDLQFSFHILCLLS
jgi:hypothetical protein